jgi:small subunit ribosomal protein S4e
MSKKHLKRLNTPTTWNIKRKENKYIKRPYPGAHSFNDGMPLSIFLKDLLNFAKTNKEVKNILNKQEVLIDGIKRKDSKFIVGLMDVISLPYLKENFRVILNKKGKLDIIKINESESKLKICKIIGKSVCEGKLQINLFDGRNILAEKKDCKVGDSVLVELPEQKIKEIIKLENGSMVLIVDGKKSGKIAVIEDIKDNIMKCRDDEGSFETSKAYAFAIGTDKSLIKIE